jgi:transcription elongation factor Elf1
MSKIVITGWKSILRCTVCGSEKVSRVYGDWSIGCSTISQCHNCGKVTNHQVVAKVAETVSYDNYLSNLKAELVIDQ